MGDDPAVVQRGQGLDLNPGGAQRIGLHIDHHDVHALAGGDAGALQAKARGGAGKHSGLALETLGGIHAERSFLIWKPKRGKWTCTVPARGSCRRTTTSSVDKPTSAPETGSLPESVAATLTVWPGSKP